MALTQTQNHTDGQPGGIDPSDPTTTQTKILRSWEDIVERTLPSQHAHTTDTLEYRQTPEGEGHTSQTDRQQHLLLTNI